MHHSRLCAVLIDCKTSNVDEAARFWGEVLGRPVDPSHPGSRGNYRMLEGTVTRTSAQTKRSRQGALSGGHRRTCPLLGSLSSEEAERSARDQVALEGEGVVDGGVNGEEALR
jgi:hypothetical protein